MSILQERTRIIQQNLQSILARRAAAGGISPSLPLVIPGPVHADYWEMRIWKLEQEAQQEEIRGEQ